MSEKEQQMMLRAGAPLVHCPASNLKLASGIAPIEEYYRKGLKIGLGCDGAPCNNTMDPFIEARLCALIQKPKFGPTALPATVSFELATLGGARVLGAEDRLGSLEPGKLADVVVVDRSHPSVYTVADPYSALVYSCTGRDVTDVIVNGRVVVRDREHQIFEQSKVLHTARKELQSLLKRV
jgi:cytosine/adenosine deaminase-related metal-dependent hydrolase